MDWIALITNPIVIGILATGLSLLLLKLFKIKVDKDKIADVILAITNAIFQTAKTDKTGTAAYNNAVSLLKLNPQNDKKLAKLITKNLGVNPVQTVYDEITKEAPKGEKSNALKSIMAGITKYGLPILIGGLTKKIFK